MRFLTAAVFPLALVLASPRSGSAQQLAALSTADRTHATAEWANISAHLPDRTSATPAKLETAADTLRARRYPQDALIFYSAALSRGGDANVLLDKMGVACLELQQITLARTYFQQAVHLNKKNPEAWNNLGAAAFVLRDTRGAIRDYKRAVKLKKDSAAFHSNLALAYFEAKQPEDARLELAKALQIDPDLLHRSSQDGYTAQVLASDRYPEICFEMARIYAAQGNIEAVLDWLTKATERGFDVHGAMDRDPALRPLLADVRIQTILKNQQVLRAKLKAPANIPTLGAADH